MVQEKDPKWMFLSPSETKKIKIQLRKFSEDPT